MAKNWPSFSKFGRCPAQDCLLTGQPCHHFLCTGCAKAAQPEKPPVDGSQTGSECEKILQVMNSTYAGDSK